MNDLLEIISSAFKEVKLESQYSLLEVDFFDTHNRHFDQIDDQYLEAVGKDAKQLILDYGFDYPREYLNIAIKAAVNRSRTVEPYKNWTEVSYDYLYYFAMGCSFLTPIAYKFYLPAALSKFLSYYECNENTSFIDNFLYRIEQFNPKDIDLFSIEQRLCISEFLNFYSGLDLNCCRNGKWQSIGEKYKHPIRTKNS